MAFPLPVLRMVILGTVIGQHAIIKITYNILLSL